MHSYQLQEQLENNVGSKLKLKINDNHSTMLSVRWEPNCTKVSLHRMFLRAPKNVMEALACYLKRSNKIIPANVQSFIEENFKKLDYSYTIDPKTLSTQGKVYNLRSLYKALNKEYFNDRLKLSITWFGNTNKRFRTRITFGLYHDSLKLIKIHRLLDNPAIPEYVIAYVIYHEMLHHECPSYRDVRGFQRIHSKEFKEREAQFRYYDLAQRWIKANQKHHFRGIC